MQHRLAIRAVVDRVTASRCGRPVALAAFCLVLMGGAAKAEAPPLPTIEVPRLTPLTDIPRLETTCQSPDVAQRIADLRAKKEEVFRTLVKLDEFYGDIITQIKSMSKTKESIDVYQPMMEKLVDDENLQQTYQAYSKVLDDQISYYMALPSCGEWNLDGGRRTSPPATPAWPGPLVPAPQPPAPLPPCRSKDVDLEIAATEDRIGQLQRLEGELGKTYADDLTGGTGPFKERYDRYDAERADIRAVVSELRALKARLGQLQGLPACPRTQAVDKSHAMATGSPPPSGVPVGLDAAVLDEINFARSDPAEYASRLRDQRAAHPPKNAADAADIDSAIAYVERQQPVAALIFSAPLGQTAAWLAADQGVIGGVAHVGTDGSTVSQRMQGVGVWAGSTAENIALGPADAGTMVMALVIDRGVPGYGHRTTLFDPGLQIAGVGCDLHRLYGYICVIDFAGEVVAR